jgi:hypothetical protein
LLNIARRPDSYIITISIAYFITVSGNTKENATIILDVDLTMPDDAKTKGMVYLLMEV